MFKEIERTYICKDLTQYINDIKHGCINWLEVVNEYTIHQYILIKNETTEVRLRRYNYEYSDKYELTIKNGHGNVRHEVNIKLNETEYFALAPKIKNNYKVKDMVEISSDGLIIYYNNVNDGKLFYIDIEFDSEEDMKAFDIYDYIDETLIIEEVDKSTPKEYIKEGEN